MKDFYSPKHNPYIDTGLVHHVARQYHESDSLDSGGALDDPLYRLDVYLSTPLGYEPESGKAAVGRAADGLKDLAGRWL